jgi:hypothetical protein
MAFPCVAMYEAIQHIQNLVILNVVKNLFDDRSRMTKGLAGLLK